MIRKSLMFTLTALLCLGIQTECMAQDNNTPVSQKEITSEEPVHTSAYTAAYQKLISYKTAGYSNMSVEEFNNSLTSEMENLPELFSAYDQVYESLPVEDENYSFITFTLNTSLNELYAEEIGEKAALSGCLEKKSRPVTPLPGEENLPQQEEIYEFQLYAPYTIEHTILNPELLTVGERDRIIHTFQTELADYVDTLSEEDVTDGNIKQALTKKAAESAENLSTETIRLSCEFSGIEVLDLGQEDIIE